MSAMSCSYARAILLPLLLSACICQGYLSPRVQSGFLSPSFPPHGALTQMWAKGGARTKGKKNVASGSRKTSAAKRTSSTKATPANMPSAKKAGPVRPPWQVVNQKELKKRVSHEKQRRDQANKGVHQTKEEEALAEQSFTLSKAFLDTADQSLLGWKRFSASPQDKISFVGAYLDKRLPPRLGVPEVAFLGRSNVGKSSLLNKLTGSETARVGKTPGATASVNLYGYYRKEKPVLGLVDLPGFGYAKLSKEVKQAVEQAAENYLGKRKELMLGILLVDIRRKPSDDDRGVLAALFDMGVPIVVVATKTDKVSNNQLEINLEAIRDGLGLPEGQPLAVSSMTGKGMKDMWKIIMEACEQGVSGLRQEKLNEQQENQPEPVYYDYDEGSGYNQGYDWVQSSSVMYEGDDDDEDSNFFDEEDEFRFMATDEQPRLYDSRQNTEDSNLSFRELKKMAKEMEKRGDV